MMPDVQVTMANPGPTTDIPTGSKARLNPPSGAVSPITWTKNGTAWKAPTAPVRVDPTLGRDDIYEAVDAAGASSRAVVRWRPDPPANATLAPGRGNASVSWRPGGDHGRSKNMM
jgi:hypothetical protein